MADRYNLDRNKFYHISRGAELVITKDRDCLAFYPDTIPFDATSGMELDRDSGGTSILYKSASPAVFVKGERMLLYGRVSGTRLSAGPRWVPYINASSDPDDADQQAILPLREVYSPRVAYDRTSNTLHLWFWTNMNYDYQGDAYDESKLYYLGTQGFQSAVDYNPSYPAQLAKRVLCYTTGQFHHCYVKGGIVSGYKMLANTGTLGFDNNTYDIIPVFVKPKIINIDTTGIQGPGVITDGWCGPQGIQIDIVSGMQWTGTQFLKGIQKVTVLGVQGPQTTSVVFEGVQVSVVRSVAFSGTTMTMGVQSMTVMKPVGAQSNSVVFTTVDCPPPPTGAQGSVGSQGPMGFQGPQGPQGFQGFQGDQGPQGFQGFQGEQGPQGFQGFQGNQGDKGDIGNQGPEGPKPAIVKSGDGFAALACIEAPEVLFFDVMRVRHRSFKSTHAVDRRFIETCEEGSLCVVSVSCSVPVALGASITGDMLELVGDRNLEGLSDCTVLVCGTRKGFAGWRMPSKTEEQYRKNNSFWNSF